MTGTSYALPAKPLLSDEAHAFLALLLRICLRSINAARAAFSHPSALSARTCLADTNQFQGSRVYLSPNVCSWFFYAMPHSICITSFRENTYGNTTSSYLHVIPCTVDQSDCFSIGPLENTTCPSFAVHGPESKRTLELIFIWSPSHLPVERIQYLRPHAMVTLMPTYWGPNDNFMWPRQVNVRFEI